MSNRLNGKKTAERNNQPQDQTDTTRLPVASRQPAMDAVTGVPRRWLIGAATLLGALTLIAAAFSMWVILHGKPPQ